MVFFKDWNDDTWANAVSNVVLMVLGIIAYGVWITTNSIVALTYVLMILLIGVLWAVDYVWEANPVVESIGLGDKKRATTALLIGAIVIILPTFLQSSVTGTDIFFTVIVAGWVEEAFFRGHLIPTAIRTMHALEVPFYDVIGAVIGNTAFALYHWKAYNADPSAIMFAFIFGMVVTVGNYLLKSTGFGIGAHILNNLKVVMHLW